MKTVTLYSGSNRQDGVRELTEAYKELKQVINRAEKAPADGERLPIRGSYLKYLQRQQRYIQLNQHTSSWSTLMDLMSALNTSQSSGSDHCYKCCLDQLDYKTFKKKSLNLEDSNLDSSTLRDIENAIQTTCSLINQLRAEIQEQQEPVYRCSALNSPTVTFSKSSPDRYALKLLSEKYQNITRLKAGLKSLVDKLAL